MMNRSILFSLLAGVPAIAVAQDAPPAEIAPADVAADDDIVVVGQRPRGSVLGDIPPEVQLNAADIRTYGVSSISDLIAELSPQISSGQGRGAGSPVVLLNGRRISGFSEIRDIPTEAIQRVEILPEEVALKYGYRPDQKVVNIVLRRRFRSVTAELEGAMPTEGGQTSFESDNSLLRINENGRFNLALKYQRSTALFEDERDIIPDTPRQPFDITGNITAFPTGGEIDPALSAIAGRAVTVAGVPVGAAAGSQPIGAFTGDRRVSDTGAFRTLLPRTDALTMNAVLNRTIFGNVGATVNGTLTYNESDSAQGLAGARIRLPGANPFSPFTGDTQIFRYLDEAGALTQANRSIAGHLGFTLNGALSGWQWTVTGNYDRTTSRTRTRTGLDLTEFQTRVDALDPLLNPFADLTEDLRGDWLTDRARSTASTGNVEAVVNGTLVELPAGPVSATFKLGGEMNDFDARSTRFGILNSSRFSRDIANGQASVDLPIASARRGFAGALGELSANVNVGYDRLSDFGGLTTLGYGLRWIPVRPLNIIASVTHDEGAPTVQQLGNPTIITPGARIFDYVRGETVDIERLSGGNASLLSDKRRVIKLGATLKPFAATDLTVTGNYTNSRTRNPIASFPTATAAIEAAFPDRFVRNAAGQLVRVDNRPINFTRQNREQVRWGINFSRQLSSPPGGGGPNDRPGERPPEREAAPQEGLQRPGGPGGTAPDTAGRRATEGEGPPRGGSGGGPRGFGGPGGPGGPRGPGGRGTRLQMSIYHTLFLRDDILIRPDVPLLDLLDGDAIGSTGGQSRNQVEAQVGLTHNGYGARLTAAYQDGTSVRGGPTGNQDLRFSSLTTVNLRLFANLGQQEKLVTAVPFLRGSRLSVGVTNLFNQRIDVRDGAGGTPIGLQPGYLDPLGRSVRVSFRKLFFPSRPPGR